MHGILAIEKTLNEAGISHRDATVIRAADAPSIPIVVLIHARMGWEAQTLSLVKAALLAADQVSVCVALVQ